MKTLKKYIGLVPLAACAVAFVVGIIAIPAQAQSIPTISPFIVDTSGNITQRVASTPFKLTGISDGCAQFASGILGSTGSACGSGGGGGVSGLATSSLAASAPITLTVTASSATFGTSFSTSTFNAFSAQNTFTSLFATLASSTNATTTNLSIKSITSKLLKTNSEGDVVAAVLGTDFVNGSGVSGNCVQWGASNALTDTGSPCGSGSGGVTSLAGTANQITASGSTGSVTLSLPNHVIFPVDFLATNSSTTNATTTGSVYFSALSAGGLAIDANHKVYSAATTTAGTGLQYSGNAFNVTGLTTTQFASANVSQWTNDAGYLANTRNINTTYPLQGGGNLTADRTLTFAGLGTTSPFTQGQLAEISNNNTIFGVGTSTPGVSAPIGYSGTLGSFVGGVAGNFTCTTASAGVTGCLSGTDYNTFAAKQGSISVTFPITLSGSTVGFGGLSTSSAISAGQNLYVTGVNTVAGEATGTLSGTANQLTVTGTAYTLLNGATLSLPSHVIFPGDFFSPAGTTTNATTTGSQYFTGVTASRPLYVDSTGKLTSAGSGTSGNCVNWGANNTLGDAGSACGSGGTASAQGSTTASYIVYKAGTTYYAYNASTTVVTSNSDFSTLLQATVNSMGGTNGGGQGGKIFFQPGVYYANSTTTSSGNDQSSTLNSPAIQFQGSGQESTQIVVATNTTFLNFNHQAIPTVSDLSCYYKGGGSCITAISTIANSRSIYQFDFHNLFFGATTTVTTAPFVLSNVLRGTISNIEFFGVHGCAVINEQGNFNAGDFTWTHSFCETDGTAGAIALNFSTSTGATGWVNQVHFTQFDAIADGTGATYVKAQPLLWSTFDDMGVEQFDTFVDSGNGFDSIGNTFNFKYMTPRSTAGLTMFKMVAGAQGNDFSFGDLNSEQSIVVINDANGNSGDPNMISGYIGQDVGTASVVNSGGTLVVRDIKGYGTMDTTLEPGGVAMPFGVPGWLGIGTSSPGTQLSIGATNGLNITSTGTSTFGTAANGININAGCFAIRGTCVGGGGGSGTVTSVTAATPNSTLTLGGTNPVTTSGTINFDLNLAHSNIWSVLQNFSNASSSLLSVFNTLYIGGTSTSTFVGNGATSTNQGSFVVATTSPNAFVVQDQFGTQDVLVNTASTTGVVFAAMATTSKATSCGGLGISCLFSIDQYGHIAASSTVPVLSSCGTNPSLSSDSSDAFGTITVGSVSATACTLTFGSAHTIGTHCTISEQTGSVTNVGSYTESLTGFTYSQTALTSDKLDYICTGQ